MKRSLSHLLLGVSVLLCASTVTAQTRGPHKASQLVTLQPGPLESCPDGSGGYALNVRLNADGTTMPFDIPDQHVLVVTGMDWSRCVPGNPNLLISLVPYHTAGPGDTTPFAYLFGMAGPNACGGGNSALTGIAVKAARTVCVSANANSPQQRVHGYLAPDR